MHLDAIDVVVRDVPAAAAFFRDVLGLNLRYAEERFAEFDAGNGMTVMLTPDLMVPSEPARGTVLHFRVPDVGAALRQVRERGARVLLEPTRTDWGWEMAMIAGPEEVLIDLYRPLNGGM